jgi:type I site-specific restriction endonuclease
LFSADRNVLIDQTVECLDDNGKLVTESLRDYSRKALRQHYASLDEFLRRWNAAERKEAVIEELTAEGLLLDPLLEEVGTDLTTRQSGATGKMPSSRPSRIDTVIFPMEKT